MRKSFISCVLIAALLVIHSFVLANAELDLGGTYFNPELTNSAKESASASEWLSTSFERSYLTVLLALDMKYKTSLTSNQISSFLANTSYVGCLDLEEPILLLLGLSGNNESLMVLYKPLSGVASYTINENPAYNKAVYETAIQGTISQFCNKYYKNDLDEVFSIFAYLTGA